jgi:hypothetical protein
MRCEKGSVRTLIRSFYLKPKRLLILTAPRRPCQERRMHNLRIFFMGSPACGLDFKPEVPHCNSLTEIDSRREQIHIRGEAQERKIALADCIQWIKTNVDVVIIANDTFIIILSTDS